jgi:hypothetical protein
MMAEFTDMTRRAKVTKVLLLLIPLVLVLPLVLLMGQRTDKEKPSFYQGPMKESDVWRLPLVEPYEFITAYCCASWNYQPAGASENFTADSVNYVKGYILYFGYPDTYGFLNTHRQQAMRMATRQAFVDSLIVKGIPPSYIKQKPFTGIGSRPDNCRGLLKYYPPSELIEPAGRRMQQPG